MHQLHKGRISTTLLLAPLITLLTGCVDNLLYHPQGRAVNNEQNTLLLTTNAGKTIVTTEPRAGGKAIIYFGGNAEDVSLNLASFRDTFPAHSLYLMHYRGYGGSDGQPGEEAIYTDAMQLYDHVKLSHDSIVLIGRSLGSGVATRLAAERDVSRLILVTPFSSIEDVASSLYGEFLVSILLTDKYLSWRYAQDVKAPAALLIAGQDTIIPRESAMKLYDSFSDGVARIYLFETAGHNNISGSPGYYELLRELTQ